MDNDKLIDLNLITPVGSKPLVKCELPEFGGCIWLKEISAEEFMRCNVEALVPDPQPGDEHAKKVDTWRRNLNLLAACACDKDGNPLRALQPKIEAAGAACSEPITRAVQMALELNGLNKGKKPTPEIQKTS